MEEYGRLSHLRLLQFLVCSLEHDIGNTITKNLVCFLKKFLCKRVVIIQILTHAYKLRSLSGKYKCFHFLTIFINNVISDCKITIKI